MTETIRKRCRRLGPIVLAGLLLAQLAIGLHKVTHGDALQETQCSLCVSANHVNGPPPVGLHFEPPAGDDESIFYVQPGLNPARLISPYESRAPPRSS